jgi:hypothetical protein
LFQSEQDNTQEAEAEVEALPMGSSAWLSAKECLLVQLWRERRPRGRDCPKAKVQLVLKKSRIPLAGEIGSVAEQANTEERMDCRCDVSCRINQQALRLQLQIERERVRGLEEVKSCSAIDQSKVQLWLFSDGFFCSSFEGSRLAQVQV